MKHRLHSVKKRLAPHFPDLAILILALSFSTWLMVHTFSYDAASGSMRIAARLWSDFAAHIPLIRSFSMGNNITHIEYPIFPGEPIRYHYIFYLLIGLLERIGLRIDIAMNIFSIAGFFFLIAMVYALAVELTHRRVVGVLAIMFFLFNGTLAFLKFFTIHPLSWMTPADIVSASEFPAFAPWDGGDILAFWNLNIYTNQRHLAPALSIALFTMWLFLRISRKKVSHPYRWCVSLGILLGALPYFHQPTLVIIAAILGSYVLLFPRIRIHLITTGGIATLLIIPQLLLQPPQSGSIAWYPGFYIHDSLTLLRFVQYWFHNIGLHILIIPLGVLLAPGRMRKAMVPALLVFIAANTFRFSKELAASHKFLNFAMIIGGIATAYALSVYWEHVRTIRFKWFRPIAATYLGVTMTLLTLSGMIDFFVIANDKHLLLEDIGTNNPATWIQQNTPPGAVFLNSSYLYHPASVAGRKIFLGWPYFAWSAGYDTDGRLRTMKRMYETRDQQDRCALLRDHSITHLTVQDTGGNPDLPMIDVRYYRDTYTPLYETSDGTFLIFTTEEMCEQ